MAVTLQTIIDQARMYLNDQVPAMNQVQLHTTGVVTFAYDLGSIQEGTRFSAGLQTFFVWNVTESVRQAQVSVVQGSTSGLMSAGTLVTVSPRYTPFELMATANTTLVSLSAPSSGLYQMKAGEFQYTASLDGYDLSGEANIQSIYEVLMEQPGPFKNWPRMQSRMWRLNRNASPTDFTSGMSLTLNTGPTPGYDVRVTYKTGFGSFATLADTTTTVGLPDSCADLVSLGAAIRLMSGAEVARNDTSVQGDARHMNEVPPGAVQNSVQGLRMLYQQRLAEESGRLAAAYPAIREG